ncbi:YheC/YheD family protein [Bacillus salitolerans]|uniref:YheC/YheD family protein n=1 Tax=Bacillus salitolerans TaxID=1437434 RepID=A0ABW4LL96_9BACI
MKLVIDDNLPRNRMVLPLSMKHGFMIPDEIKFEIRFEGSSLIVGPVILLILPEYYHEISHDLLTYCEAHLHHYEEINGLFVICRNSDIHVKSKKVNGYCYVLNKNKTKRWIKGSFPYPQAVFNRAKKLEPSLYNSLYDVIGDRLFNSDFIGKWKQYQLFTKHPLTRIHLPETLNLTSRNVLDTMLSKYQMVYLKPHNSANGKGIFTIEKNRYGYKIKDTNNKTVYFKVVSKALAYLKEKGVSRQYIVQQPVPYRYNNRNVDFRFYMQKNKTKSWTSPGFAAKISTEDSINTNYQNREILLYGEDALKTLYQMNQSEIRKTVNDMFAVCKAACEVIERQGVHLGDVAFDLIIDRNHKIWLLELQIRYGRERSLPDQVFIKNMSTPIEYAKALAGF